MKNILNVIRIIIIIYLITFTAVMVSMYTKRKVYNDEFPTVMGYTYIKVDSDIYEPDIKKNNIIRLDKTRAVDVNDYIAFKYTNTVKLGKVEKVNKYKVYIKDDNGVLNEYDLQDVYGKMIYNNDERKGNIFTMTVTSRRILIAFNTLSCLTSFSSCITFGTFLDVHRYLRLCLHLHFGCAGFLVVVCHGAKLFQFPLFAKHFMCYF